MSKLKTLRKLPAMSTKYKFTDKAATYFTTSTIVGWIDVFTRDLYRNILLDSFRYCQKNQGLKLHAWVLNAKSFSFDLFVYQECKSRNGRPSQWVPQ